MPVELWPVMQHRMEEHRAKRGKWGIVEEDPELEAKLIAEVRDRGPSTARDLDDGLPRTKEHWGWNWSNTRRVLDYLYTVGDLAIAGRNSQFEVLYDLPERVIPAEILARETPSPAEASRELVRRAARSHGVATAQCLRDYYRMHTRHAGPAIAELVEDGELAPGHHRRLEAAGVPPPRRPAAAPRARPRAAQPVRPAGLGARADRAPLRLPLPHRDLRARAPAGARLLRAAVPARRPDRRPGRPQGRPHSRVACW